MKNLRLRTLLIERALITPHQLDEALALTNGAGLTWVEHLLVTGALDEERLCTVVSQTAFVQKADPEALIKIPRDVLALLPSDVAFEHRVVPLGFDVDGDLRLAMLDPTCMHAVEESTFFANRPVVREAATATSIAWALHEHFGARSALWPRAPRQIALVA